MTVKQIQSLAVVNIGTLLFTALQDKTVQDSILELNTKVQLLGLGENSEGIKLSDIGGGYSPVTLALHPEKTRDKVTLHDTGEFYDSFKLIPESLGDFEMTADPKKDDTNLFTEWGKEIVGLNNENYIKALKIIERKVLSLIIGNV